METTQPKSVPCRDVVTGFNYRRRYDPKALQELQDSIKNVGLAQRVVMRPLPNGKHQLLVGGRRFKAWVSLYGEDSEIPADIRVLSDVEATAMMMAENHERENPSVIEDAEGANRMLVLCNGDRNEAAARLGWERQKLDRRLGLMNAIQEVRDAYIDEKIDVGHVEILAALRKEVQLRVITTMLEAEKVPTVEQLKAMAKQSMLDLEVAIFDKTDCTSCQYFTGLQQSLFDTSFDGTRCTNSECYQSKTEAELEKRRAALTDDYQVVRIVRPGDNSTVVPLRAEGERGVGEQQAKACRACGDFGACVSAVPDKLGKVYKEVCFNKNCNDEKVAAERKKQKAEAAPPAAVAHASQADKPQDASAQPAEASDRQSQARSQSPAEASPPTVASIRNALKEYREGMWRLILKHHVAKLPTMANRAFLAAFAISHGSRISGSAARDGIKKATGVDLPYHGSGKTLRLMLDMDQSNLGSALQVIAAAIDNTLPISDVVDYLQALEVNISNYWKLNETYLNVLTKSEIEAVAAEVGLEDACGKHFAAIKGGSKADFVAALLKVEGFEYRGAVPQNMRWD